MKYLEVREEALIQIEKDREEAAKVKREAAALEIKELMLEIERTEELLTTMRDQLEEKMGEDVPELSKGGMFSVGCGEIILGGRVIGGWGPKIDPHG